MIIDFHSKFRKNFKKRVAFNPALKQKFQQRTELFRENPKNPELHDHQLTGKKRSFRAFSVTGDIRVVYRIIDQELVRFYDIGSHNQVY
ncbi:hypothetical protein A2773_06755 [Candidatus Gottesmanbacteria bacterium RIFCSPHIGHO2_01_FULL_39_10]|uniref:Type II toxin-antitoxin system mRNA interferase toxin, RelE/StbE family n=1 Tax=Candidatus Gottesmanbacteria bacterium RIFCSPHIGHO2_01_FULL_39_10 TaxID=1798375 RepID=A0A1F5ZPA0_9BACT|nr:MAG: hypothetical protein A2773_06755 [Candidatus Gottesmanbacteria bacterium RIFCSPHIGHO2_01_FULL_39_10]